MSASGFESSVELARLAARGDRRARETLFERYLPRVRQVVALRMGRQLSEMHEVDDIVQESMLDAFRSLERFEARSDATFRNWIARIVENNLRDLERRRTAGKRGGGRAPQPLVVDDSSDADLPAMQPNPSTIARANEIEEARERAVLQLPAIYREMILLRDYCGMSYEEMVADLALSSVRMAKVRYHRARKRLEELMAHFRPGA